MIQDIGGICALDGQLHPFSSSECPWIWASFSKLQGSTRGQDPNLLVLFIQLALDMRRLTSLQKIKSAVSPRHSAVILSGEADGSRWGEVSFLSFTRALKFK